MRQQHECSSSSSNNNSNGNGSGNSDSNINIFCNSNSMRGLRMQAGRGWSYCSRMGIRPSRKLLR